MRTCLTISLLVVVVVVVALIGPAAAVSTTTVRDLTGVVTTATIPHGSADPGALDNSDPGDPYGNGTSSDHGPADTDIHSGNGTEGHSGHESEEHLDRVHVAKLDFPYVATPFIVSCAIVVAIFAKIGFHTNDKLSSYVPESCMLILLGVLLGLIFYYNDVQDYEMSSRFFFIILLPPIILDAGYNMPQRAFFDNLGTILLFAVIGTLFNTMLIGFSLWGFTNFGIIDLDLSEMPLLHFLLFATLISAVDPVAVLAVFEEVHVNELLHIVVFGESLLNDAVTVVLYHMFEAFAVISVQPEGILLVDWISGVGSFFVVGLGGTGIGVLFALLTSVLTRFTHHCPVVEPLFVVIMGYLSYLTAEIFHLSGIMACTFCGIIMKKYVEANITKKSVTSLRYFVKMLASISETIIFMFLGLSTVTDAHEWNTAFVLLTLAFCLVYRTCGVIIFSFLANIFRANKLTLVDQFVMAYGGLRGAIAFSLAVLLTSDHFPKRNLIITTTVVVVYFTVFIMGTTIKPLVGALHVKLADDHQLTMNEQLHGRMLDHMMAGVEDIIGSIGHHELRARFSRINHKYLKPMLLRSKEMKGHGLSLLNMYNKLNEKEAQEYINQHGGLTYLPENSRSIYQYFQRTQGIDSFQSASDLSQSGNSLQMLVAAILSIGEDDNSNFNSFASLPGDDLASPLTSTVLDMRILDDKDADRDLEDIDSHHLLTQNMFKPRSKFTPHKRHVLEEKTEHRFHHKSRLHLRQLLQHKPGHHHGHHHGHRHGKSHGHHRGHHHGTHNGHHEGRRHGNHHGNHEGEHSDGNHNHHHHNHKNKPDTEQTENHLESTPKKELAEIAEVAEDNKRVIKEKKQKKAGPSRAVQKPEAKTAAEPKHENKEDKKNDNDDDDDDYKPTVGVTFYLEDEHTETPTEEPDEAPASHETLPWKRASDNPSSTPGAMFHLQPYDEVPQISQVPSWVNNLGYTDEEHEIPPAIMNLSLHHQGPNSAEDLRDPRSELPAPWKREDVDEEPNPVDKGEDNPAFEGDEHAAPWRKLGPSKGAKRSPSLKREAKLQQHPSTASLRQSEADSHHSELYRRHSQVMEPIRSGLDVDRDLEMRVDLDVELAQQDGETRVSSWLDANSDNLSSTPDEDDIYTSYL